jgi:hypothetical protein
VEYEITNLTRDQVFKDVSFYIITKRGRLSDPDAIPIAPAKISDRSPTKPEVYSPESPKVTGVQDMDPTIARFRLPEFHPGWRFRLRVRLTGGTPKDTIISFDYSNRADAGLNLKAEVAPVRFVESSAETFIVEYDFNIIAAIFVTSLIAIILYAFHGMKHR